MSGSRVVWRRALAAAVVAGALALAGCGSSSPSSEPAAGRGAIEIRDAWSRATPASATTGVVYLTVANGTDEDATLLGASVPSDVATDAQVHETVTEDAGGSATDDGSDGMGGMTTMREVPTVTVPAHGAVRFEPGGYHIMLVGLRAPLEQGRTFTVTLARRGGSDLTATVTVRDA